MPSLLAARRTPQHHRSSAEGRCRRTASCAAQPEHQQLFGSITDLPTLVTQRIVTVLDPASRLELRKVNKLCRHAVDNAWKLVCVPLDQVKQHGMEQLASQFPSASCLVISAPQHSVSLSILGRRRRCEQLLSVLLDNTIRPPLNLTALDVSHSVSSITSATLQLLVEAFPRLLHLALPAVAGVGASGQWEVVRLLGQLQQLQSCEINCTFFAVGCHSGHEHQQHTALPGQLQQTAQIEPSNSIQPTVLTVLHQDQQLVPGSPQDQQHASNLNSGFEQHALAGRAVLASLHSTLNQQDGSQAHSAPSHRHVQQQLLISNGTAMYSTISSTTNFASELDTAMAAADSSLQQRYHQRQDPKLHICQLMSLQPHPSRPWANLGNLTHLQQLQLSHPCSLQDLFENLKSLTSLASLGLVRVHKGLSSVLLDPGFAAVGVGDGGQGLGQLKCLQSLTRLELGLDAQCSCIGTSTNSSLVPRLVTPAHISTSELNHPSVTPSATAGVHAGGLHPAASATPAPMPAAGVMSSHYSCCWSHLTQLRVLALSGGICLDMSLLAATADCVHLTELKTSGLLLETDAPVAYKGLQELRVLTVTQRFCLGVSSAAVLFPVLEKLSIKDDGLHCPDLSCLKHHPTISSLAIEAPSSGWQLSSLQLSYLVHMDTLKQLSLASRCWGPTTTGHGPQLGVQSPASPRGSKSPGVLRCVSGTLQASNSSHWLPTATLTQVTSLTLAGPANDHTLSQLPSQFPGLVTLQLLGSYYASDWGLKRLSRAPVLSSLLLEGCEHVTEYGLEALLRGGSIRVLAVHGCGGVDERACQRIRRACRYSCTNLSWHGTDGLQNLQHLQHHHGKHTSGSNSTISSSSAASGWATSSIASADSHHDLSYFDTDGQHCNFGSSNEPSSSTAAAATAGSESSRSRGVGGHQCSSGSEFLERCWRESFAAQDNVLTAAKEVEKLLSRSTNSCSPCASSSTNIAECSASGVNRQLHYSSSNSSTSDSSGEADLAKEPCVAAQALHLGSTPQGVTVAACAGLDLAAAAAPISAVTTTGQAACTPATAACSTSSSDQGKQAADGTIDAPTVTQAASIPSAVTAAVTGGINSRNLPNCQVVSLGSGWGCSSTSCATQRSSLTGCAR